MITYPKHMITYPKHEIDVYPLKYRYYLNMIFNHYEKSYLVTKISYEKNRIKDYRLLCALHNKNSELYSELIIATNKFNKDIYKHIVSMGVSGKILKKANIHICKRIKIILYEEGVIRYLYSKKELIPIISVYF